MFFFLHKIISSISTYCIFFWITFIFLFYFLFFFFFLRFFYFYFYFYLLLKFTYQFLIVRVTRSMLAGGRLPSVKIRVPLPFPLWATWPSCYYRFGSCLGQRVSVVLDFFPETRDRPGLILHTFLPFYYRRCPSRTTGWKLKLCKVTIEWKVCEFCNNKDWFKWLVFCLVHQLPNDLLQRTGLMPCTSGWGCSCRRWTACEIRCQNIYTVQVTGWLLTANGLLELLQSGQLNDILRKLIPVLHVHGARKETVFHVFVGIWWCTKSGKSDRLLPLRAPSLDYMTCS